MATVTPEISKVTLNIKLSNGLLPSGSPRLVAETFPGTLNPETFDDAKAWNIINALKACLALDHYQSGKTVTYNYAIA